MTRKVSLYIDTDKKYNQKEKEVLSDGFLDGTNFNRSSPITSVVCVTVISVKWRCQSRMSFIA